MKTEIIRNYSSSSLSSLADSINQVNNTGSTNPLHINNNEDGKGGGIGGSSQSVVGSIASKFCSKKAVSLYPHFLPTCRRIDFRPRNVYREGYVNCNLILAYFLYCLA